MKPHEFNTYANSFQAIARLGLESIDCLLKHLENPEHDLKFIHIAGTNGKGSVSAFLQSILTDSGLKCGKFISPNMLSVCERISIDGVNIPQTELDNLLEKVRLSAIKVQSELGEYPTQFEIWTAAAFLYFKSQKCDIVVLEVGLGGRKDATNIIPPPLISIITHIAMDHTEYLGNTLKEIATEKAGIIKEPINGTGYTITTAQAPEVQEVLTEICLKRKNTLIFSKTPQSLSFDENGEYFNYAGIQNIHSSMLGLNQLQNAALAIETALLLKINPEYIKSGIKKAKNMGRFEIVSKSPLTVFDGAHNPDGMSALANSLNRYFPQKTKSVIMASMKDKDLNAIITELKTVKNIAAVYTVQVTDNPRSLTAWELSDIINNLNLMASPCIDIKEALARSDADMTVICGSLYLYKDFYNQKNNQIPGKE